MPGPNASLQDETVRAICLHRPGILNDEEYRRITIRHLGAKPLPTAAPISSKEIRKTKESAHLSQAAFARHLTPGYTSQVEQGVKQPKGPALALLNIIRRKGFTRSCSYFLSAISIIMQCAPVASHCSMSWASRFHPTNPANLPPGDCSGVGARPSPVSAS